MSFSEKLYGGLGWVVGGAVNVVLKGAGLVAELASDDDAAGRRRREAFSEVGTSIHDGATAGGKMLGRGIAAVSRFTATAGGATAETVAELAGASKETATTARKVGTFVGGAVPGLVAGEVLIGGAVDALGAAHGGLHGAAAAAHGEKLVGAVVGGGQAAGQAIEAGVVAASSLAGTADSQSKA